MSSPSIDFSSGFSLIEILVVAGLLLLIAGLGMIAGLDYYRSYVFLTEQNTLVSTLEVARMRALSSINGAPHGVYLGEATAIKIFQGPSFAEAADVETISANTAVARSGLTEVTFSQLNGDASAEGTITLSDGKRTRDINLNYEGRIEW